jgi:AbrB family looped-hinge helix DNA binding protein
MSQPGDAAMPLVKIKDKGQVTLPARIRERRGLHAGVYLEVQEEGNRIVLIPQDVAPRHPEIDKAIAEGLADVRAGRVTPAFKNMAEYRAWRKTPEGKKFARS